MLVEKTVYRVVIIGESGTRIPMGTFRDWHDAAEYAYKLEAKHNTDVVEVKELV